MESVSMSDLLSRLGYFLRMFTNVEGQGGTSHFMERLVNFIVADPLIMAVASLFFVGVIVAFFMRVYHSIL